MSQASAHLKARTIALLSERGVSIEAIANLVMFLQKDYLAGLTLAQARASVLTVLQKREVQNAILTGIQLDLAAEHHTLLEPLQTIVEEDEGLYGLDETMALSIVNLYGSIGFTNYGYIDRLKPGILKLLNAHQPGIIHTFLDDLVGAVAAAAAARLAHDTPQSDSECS
ncbi:phosphatidylglycerophosphatase A [Levilactobacillus namurensis DSM 19117]|uniref:Phosphatidylglycerophosphatase A n=1 Tax=Levilactobacillus namurensis DSM 19117 TaxID=1423773 RepID=A0A0R1JVL7_9LACO|nr:phosphatidylglycerophosphatase A [Levilactobacillus namurensis]KRK72745.1 phosphatidylglycerophosphatase A [Levilactobacillus namurensis DSM 19117]GEO74229.1 phosphatidylglycerophosphatase A [Levilactobacillus namurensis]